MQNVAKIQFPNRAKYKGITYPAGTVFEVANKDVKLLVTEGAILEEKSSRREKADEYDAPDADTDETKIEGEETTQE